MKIIINYTSIALVSAFLASSQSVNSQGTFQNLNFESANLLGYSPGDYVPISAALPGWNAYFTSGATTYPQVQINYDGISTGGNLISLVDAKAWTPIQGNYSAFLFGGEGLSASISQTGTLPVGTESIRMYAWSFGPSPVVAINGQPISMSPLQTFANYTLYGGDISSYSGQVTLSITEPAPAIGGPSELELDNISFSTTAVAPEPSPLALTAVGGILFALYRRFVPKRQ